MTNICRYSDVMQHALLTQLLLAFVVGIAPCSSPDIGKASIVVVKKSESRLYLMRGNTPVASFRVALGAEPHGHKRQAGDERTPEGRYVLDTRNPTSRFHKSIHISYPNANDIAAAKARGENPGGAIMIHGQKNGFGWLSPVLQRFNWTDGCIALA
jgi:murein L,D-transpeptidase YafK